MGIERAEWQASEARHRFSEVVDAAAAGTPQLVTRRDGQAVVVVSQEYFERTKPAAEAPKRTLKDVLLNFRFEHDDGSFEEALAEARTVVGRMFMPRASIVDELTDDPPRHRRPKRVARKV